jgi:glycosyltransferase involved in cell wall biosynthesis
MNPKVTVVVPVYNAVGVIDRCIDSLLKQTLPREAFEVLLVDDGSTDDTPAMLDALAAEHPHFRVLHLPNSGWPGKPRNTGVAEARGEYVQFLDQDDHLAPDALRRLYEMGSRNGSDVVLGKVASNFRGVPHGVFREDREVCDLGTAPLYDSLTPHKMFRTAFLRDKGIAYPEGKYYLEDQPYMMAAYLQAERVSILGSYVAYYYWERADKQHAGATKIVPAEYVRSVREVLEIVTAHTEPGELRDDILRRFYRVEILGCLSGAGVYKFEPEHYRELFDLLRGLSAEYMGEAVHAGLGAAHRPRSAMLRAGDAEGFQRAVGAAAGIKAAARLEGAGWQPDGRFTLDVTVTLVRGEDRAPLLLEHRDGRYLLPVEDAEPLDVTAEVDKVAADLAIRGRTNAIEWPCEAEFATTVEPRGEDRAEIVLRGSGSIAIEALGARERLAKGLWDVWVPVRVFGQVVKARLGADRAEGVAGACLPAVLGSPARGVTPYFTDPYGNLSFDVGARSKKLGSALEGRPAELAGDHPAELRLEVFTTAAAKSLKAAFVLTGPVGRRDVPAVWRSVAGRVHLRFPERLKEFTPGVYAVDVKLDGASGPAAALGKAEVGSGGRLMVEGGLREAAPEIKGAVAARRRDERRQRSLPRRVMRRLRRVAKR